MPSILSKTRNLLLLACFSMLASAVWAQEETPSESEIDPEELARLQALSEEVALAEMRLQDLQFNEGIYSPSLTESYTDLGNLYTQLGDHDNAARVYNDALQMARINTGLYSEAQLPILESLIESHQRRRDWSKVDDLAHLDWHMHQRLFESGTENYLAAAQDFGRWQLRVVKENLLDQSSNGLLNSARNLSDYYERLLIEISPDAENPENPVLAENYLETTLSLLEGKAEADMGLARAIAVTPYTYFNGTVQRYISETRCRNVTNAQGQTVRQCYQVQVENPRYSQSQRDAKRFEINRYIREIHESLDRMQALSIENREMPDSERERLEIRIAELRTETQQIRSNSRSLFRF